MEKQFLGDTATFVLHNVDRQSERCEIERIIQSGAYRFLTLPEEATAAGFSHCQICIGGSAKRAW